jgi:hypothetical protein
MTKAMLKSKLVWKEQKIRDLTRLVEFYRGKRAGSDVRIQQMIEAANSIWGLSKGEISMLRGSQLAIEARHAVMTVARGKGLTARRIASAFGRTSQGTVSNAVNNVKNWLELDAHFTKRYLLLQEKTAAL